MGRAAGHGLPGQGVGQEASPFEPELEQPIRRDDCADRGRRRAAHPRAERDPLTHVDAQAAVDPQVVDHRPQSHGSGVAARIGRQLGHDAIHAVDDDGLAGVPVTHADGHLVPHLIEGEAQHVEADRDVRDGSGGESRDGCRSSLHGPG